MKESKQDRLKRQGRKKRKHGGDSETREKSRQEKFDADVQEWQQHFKKYRHTWDEWVLGILFFLSLLLLLFYFSGKLGVRPFAREAVGWGMNPLTIFLTLLMWLATALILHGIAASFAKLMRTLSGRTTSYLLNSRGKPTRKAYYCGLAIYAFCFVFPTIHYLNCSFGSPEPVVAKGVIVRKDVARRSSTRMRHYLFFRFDWRGTMYDTQIQVLPDEYKTAAPGDILEITYTRGYLGTDYFLSIKREDGLAYRDETKGMIP